MQIPLDTFFPGVRVATPRDLKFVEHLARKFSNQLGFLPRTAVSAYIEAGDVLLGTENGQEAGYVLGRRSMRWDRRVANIVQTAVPLDLQRGLVGTCLVTAWEFLCSTAPGIDCHLIQAWCADDIDARMFWAALGWTAVGQRNAGNARGRSLTLFRRSLTTAGDSIMHVMPPVAGYRARKTAGLFVPGLISPRSTVAGLQPDGCE
jgi:N-acetylglutamate synthase-like GNAT family acetyltransferase